MDTFVKERNGFQILFMIVMTTSAIVFIEPAPYDLLLILLIGFAFLSQMMTFQSVHFWPIILLLLFMETNLLSFFYVRDAHHATIYLLTTIYVMISWLGITGIITYFKTRLLSSVFTGYVIAALLVVIPSVAAYSQLISGLDFLLWQGRVMGFFKDPNVFGPFLVPPALYALWKMGKANVSLFITILWMFVFLIISLGVVLSYSRAAWGQFLLAIGIFIMLLNEPTTRRLKILFILCMILLPVLIYIVIATDIGDLFFDRLGMQSYDQTRFQKQEASLDYMMHYPLGFGPGQSELMLNHSTHNLFVRIIGENGVLGALFFCSFLLLTLFRSFQLSRKVSDQNKGIFVIITASLIGIIFNSMFIDTMHWRHLWLLLALPWIGISTKDGTDFKS